MVFENPRQIALREFRYGTIADVEIKLRNGRQTSKNNV